MRLKKAWIAVKAKHSPEDLAAMFYMTTAIGGIGIRARPLALALPIARRLRRSPGPFGRKINICTIDCGIRRLGNIEVGSMRIDGPAVQIM
jgi:hypothetical protein